MLLNERNQSMRDCVSGRLMRGGFELTWRDYAPLAGAQAPCLLVVGSADYYDRCFSADLRRSVRLILVDHRAMARHAGPALPDYALAHIADDIEALRQAVEVESVCLLGHSGHAYMVLEHARRYPGSVSAICLAGAGPDQSAQSRALAERRWQELYDPCRKALADQAFGGLEAALAAAPERGFVAFCLALAARSWADPTFDAAALWAGTVINRAGIDLLWGEVFASYPVAQAAAELTCPVLLLLGEQDYLVPPVSAWDGLRPLFRDLTVSALPDCGHTPMLERPDLFDPLLRQWLAEKQTG